MISKQPCAFMSYADIGNQVYHENSTVLHSKHNIPSPGADSSVV